MRIAILYTIVCFVFVCPLHTQDVPEYEQEFLTSPVRMNAMENATIFIPCQLTYMQNTTTSWFRNGQKIADTNSTFKDTPSNVEIDGDFSLMVSSIKRSDSGEYACEVSDLLTGNFYRQSHLINVVFPPKVFPEPNTGGMDVELGQTFSLVCDVIGNPLPKIRWYFQNREILVPNEHMIKFNVSQASKQHAGEYQCVADNNVDLPASAKFQIRILYSPEIMAEQTWVHSAIDHQTELSCYVDSNPRAKVDWLHKNKLLIVGSKIQTRIEGDRYTLTIKNMKFDDFGQYTCQGVNFLGRNSRSIVVSGLAKPAIFVKNPRRRTETSHVLIWETDSYSPIIQYNLRFRKQQRGDVDGRWIDLIIPAGDSGYSPIRTGIFQLDGLEPASIYEASVSAKNAFGWNNQSSIFQFATLGTDVENSSDVVDVTMTTPSESLSSVSSVRGANNDLEENASWFTDGAISCNMGIHLSVVFLSLIPLLF